MGLTISAVLRKRSEGLAEGLDWNFKKDAKLIQSHKLGGRLPVNHAQKLVSRKKPQSNKALSKKMLEYQNSCFVFGPDSKSECMESIIAVGQPVSEAPTSDTDLVAASAAPLDLITKTERITEMVAEENPLPGSDPTFQTAAKIILKANTCRLDDAGNVSNGCTHSSEPGSRSLDAPTQTQSIPRFESTLHALSSKNQENASSTMILEQIELRTLGNGSAGPGEYEDLYEA